MTRKVIILVGVPALALGAAFYVVFQELSRKSIDEWILPYTSDLIFGNHPKYSADEATDLIFLIVDHHEHSHDNEEADASTRRWIDDYAEAIKGITDSNGRKFQYSWFYPYDDRRTPASLERLASFAGKGYGEIELHWHRGSIDDDQFRHGLSDAMEWFRSYGVSVPITSNERWRTAFGYVAGNWELDNGLGRREGESNEIDHLLNAGGFADFTFPNGTSAQPPFYSRLYYSTDTPEPKSYKTGQRAEVGENNEGFLIFMGPTGLDFKEMTTEFGTVEAWWYKNFASRIDNWFLHAPTVKGKPEWRFVKTYTHGVQSRELFTGGDFRKMLEELVKYSKDRDIRLHFVTAREAYNIVQAAEDGLTGNPFQYRNYEIAPYVRSEVDFSRPTERIGTSQSAVMLKFDDSGPIEVGVGPEKSKVTKIRSGNVLICEVFDQEPVVLLDEVPEGKAEGLVYRQKKDLEFSDDPERLEALCRNNG